MLRNQNDQNRTGNYKNEVTQTAHQHIGRRLSPTDIGSRPTKWTYLSVQADPRQSIQ